MEKNLLELDHLRKLAIASKQYIDSLTLELINILKDVRDHLSNDNILDNCDFKINQRTVSGTINTPGYFVDRWKLVDGEVTIEEDGIRLNGTIQQILENEIDGEVTASVFTNEGVMSAEYDNSSKTFQIEADGKLLKMAKLEIGNRQTLARQEGNKWVLNDPPPNPAIELTKCQRYQLIFDGYFRIRADMNPKNTIDFSIPIPTSMRILPTIINPSEYQLQPFDTGGPEPDFVIKVFENQDPYNVIMLRCSKTLHGLSDAFLQLNPGFGFDANL